MSHHSLSPQHFKVATTEGNEFVTNKRSVSLSEQELVSCDSNDMGCNGGMPSRAFNFLMSSHNGFETEAGTE
jgi:hypothetical protein